MFYSDSIPLPFVAVCLFCLLFLAKDHPILRMNSFFFVLFFEGSRLFIFHHFCCFVGSFNIHGPKPDPWSERCLLFWYAYKDTCAQPKKTNCTHSSSICSFIRSVISMLAGLLDSLVSFLTCRSRRLAVDRYSVERKAEAFTHPFVNPYLSASPSTLGRGINSRRFGSMSPSSCKPILSRPSFICYFVQNWKMRQVLAKLTRPTDRGVACEDEMSDRMMIVVYLKLKMDLGKHQPNSRADSSWPW